YHGFKIGVVPETFVVHDRENRKAKELDQYSNAKLNQVELWYKVNTADINNQYGLNILYKRILSLPIFILFSLLQFKPKKAFFKLKEMLRLLVLLKKVRLSRVRNAKGFF